MRKHHAVSLAVALAVLAGPAIARGQAVSGRLLEGGLGVVLLEPSGRAVSTAEQSFRLQASGSGARLIVLDADTSVRGPVVLGIRSKGRVVPVAKARKKKLCARSDARAVTRLKVRGTRTVKLGTITVSDHVAYPRKMKKGTVDTSAGLARVDADCVPLGAGRLGVTTGTESGVRTRAGLPPDPGGDPTATAGGEDPDDDGLPNAFDADDDGDGVLDNDDPDSNRGPASPANPRFWVFSNFHQDLENSLNANAMTVTKELIDAALRRASGLAFQVVGDGAEVELDCGTLPYCTTGGTGRTAEPYPNGLKFPEDVDANGDGRGTITAGSTGDFQFRPFGSAAEGHAASDALRAGDVYLERYTGGDGVLVEVPGMLNFVFHTTPAVQRVVTGVRTYDVGYPVAPGAPGTRQNPFHVPTTGSVVVTLTVWRPQRRGIAAAGEPALVDMGNLKLVTNLPNGPCTGDQPPSCQPGAGMCPPAVYTVTDPNLTVEFDGLQDGRGDGPADPANTFTYTIDLSACVEGVAGVVWGPGQAVMVPVQMMNVYGDNAAQNVFFVRDDS
jgi:hypothetical protein